MNIEREEELEKDHTFMERIFERGLWGSRYVVVLAVIFSTVSALFFKSLLSPCIPADGLYYAFRDDVFCILNSCFISWGVFN